MNPIDSAWRREETTVLIRRGTSRFVEVPALGRGFAQWSSLPLSMVLLGGWIMDSLATDMLDRMRQAHCPASWCSAAFVISHCVTLDRSWLMNPVDQKPLPFSWEEFGCVKTSALSGHSQFSEFLDGLEKWSPGCLRMLLENLRPDPHLGINWQQQGSIYTKERLGGGTLEITVLCFAFRLPGAALGISLRFGSVKWGSSTFYCLVCLYCKFTSAGNLMLNLYGECPAKREPDLGWGPKATNIN